MIDNRSHAEHGASLKDDRTYAMPLSTQTSAVVKRTFVAYWRTPEYVIGKFMLHIVTGLFNTFTFYHVGHSTLDFQLRLFSIFMTLTISPPLIQQLQPKFLDFRNSKWIALDRLVQGTVLTTLLSLPRPRKQLADLFLGRLHHRCRAGGNTLLFGGG